PDDPLAERGARLARIDQVVNGETLGAREGRLLQGELFLELGAERFGLFRRFELAAIGDRDAAFNGQRAYFRTRPGEDIAVLAVMRRGGDAEGFFHDHAGPGDDRHDGRRNSRSAIFDRALFLRLRANHEARLIDEIHNGKVKGVAKLDKAADLLGRFRAHRAGVEFAVIGDHADAVAIEPREGRDQTGAEMASHLKEAVLIEDELHELSHIEDLAAVFR